MAVAKPKTAVSKVVKKYASQNADYAGLVKGASPEVQKRFTVEAKRTSGYQAEVNAARAKDSASSDMQSRIAASGLKPAPKPKPRAKKK